MNSNKKIKTLVITASALLAASALTVTSIAVSANYSAPEGSRIQAVSKISEGETVLLTASENNVKDETVYIFANSDGSVKKTYISDWVSSDEGDSYTRGEAEAFVPVDVKVTYKLDGKTVSAGELAGRSGRVTIRFDYENKARTEDGVYVPFVMLTGLILDNEKFTNVEITNGKLVNDGTRQIAAGFALPGLKESLDIDSDKFEIPEYFMIEADAEDFETSMCMTLGTAGIFNSLKDFDRSSLDELKEKLDEMADAADELAEGTVSLYDGMEELLEGAEKLSEGTASLADGAESLNSGAATLSGGAGSLAQGAEALSSGLKEITGNNEALNSGAAQVFTVLLQTAQTQIEAAGQSIPALTIGNYGEVLTQLINSLDDEGIYARALSQVEAAVDAMGDAVYRTYLNNNAQGIYTAYLQGIADQLCSAYISSNAEAILMQYILTNVIPGDAGLSEEEIARMAQGALAQLTEEQKEQILAGALAQLTKEQKEQIIAGALMQLTDEQKEQILAGALAQLTDEQKAQIRQGAIDQTMGSEEVQAQLEAAREQVQQLALLKAQLDTYNQFYAGLASYTAAVSQAAEGAQTLSSGAESLSSGAAALSSGAAQLYGGTKELKNSIPELLDGVTALRDGAKELKDGMNRFNEEAIDKLKELEEDKLEGLLDKAEAVRDAAKNYSYRDGVAIENVNFIYRIDGISA